LAVKTVVCVHRLRVCM